MFDEDTTEKTITITGIEQKTFDGGNTKMVLSENTTKYDLWKKKKDGNQTVAWTQFEAKPVSMGGTVTIIFREEDAEYKDVKFKRRTIVYFPPADEEKRVPVESEFPPREEVSGVTINPTTTGTTSSGKDEGFELTDKEKLDLMWDKYHA